MNFSSVKPIILASASPRRQELLQLLGLPFTVVPSDVSEEMEVENGDFAAYAEALALRKTEAVARRYEGHLVIGADTIVVHEGKVYPKPTDHEQAKTFLKTFSGKTHQVITGVCVALEGEFHGFFAETQVTFRTLDDRLLDAYIASGDPMDKAGAYGIQTAGALLVEKIEGDYYNVVGLPIAKLTEWLRGQGWIALEAGEASVDH